MVADWRKKWHVASQGQTDADFAFGICQISAAVGPPGDEGAFAGTAIRWFQTGSPPSAPSTAVGYLPNALMPRTWLATTYDLGDAASPFGSVHTRHKIEVGQRLALGALKVAYGEDVYTGPVFSGAATSAAGGKVLLTFNDTGAAGLALRPMVVNASHSQGNWSGRTPFEVCIPPGSSVKPASSVTCEGSGALGKGGDLRVANMSLAQAAAWCEGNTSCVGFTAKAAGCDVTQAVTQVYFKRAIAGKNPDKEWVAFEKSTPCTLLSRFEHWAEPPSTELSTDGPSS